jgi:hypothetical protein
MKHCVAVCRVPSLVIVAALNLCAGLQASVRARRGVDEHKTCSERTENCLGSFTNLTEEKSLPKRRDKEKGDGPVEGDNNLQET